MSQKPVGKTLADFRSAHDKNVIVPSKIKKALADMESEHPENWAYESDLIKRAGISQTDIGMFRDQFADHVIETSGRNAKKVWFASAKVAAKVR
ncbi:MAG TPA: hypothetical protein VJQ82_21715 [Terriglobales bacterium]|nr:hypothetical protein [Terriglobales bacterium]